MEHTWQFEHNGARYVATVERDEHMGAPWDEPDGHGTVSDWTSRGKAPGELVLAESRGSYRYYDFAESCRIARRDGWDAMPYNTGQESKRQQAAKAARSDYEHLRRWCNDEWFWCGVVVAPLCPECDEPDESRAESLWGIESDAGDYLIEVAVELAGQVEPRALAA